MIHDSTSNRQVYIPKIETTAFTGMELECEKDNTVISISHFFEEYWRVRRDIVSIDHCSAAIGLYDGDCSISVGWKWS